ncbi:MAG: alpha/beta hydrolase [Nitrosomonadales bacterium]|nr:alpha/beta hydrolase [Nitrosomonadales bacterium]
MMQLQTDFIHDAAPDVSGERILLLMLPGAKNTPQQLVENGFIRALRERDLPVDVLALDAHVDLYLERADIERVLHHTLDEVRARGYRRIWLLGISLGGSGAMLCATQRAPEIEGVFLLAPFLGTRGLIAEVEAAGGLRHWQAGEIVPRDHERALLKQIQSSMLATTDLPPIHLGYGSADRYRGASVMLSAHLPQHHVAVMQGGHDWETWIALWHELLDKQALR